MAREVPLPSDGEVNHALMPYREPPHYPRGNGRRLRSGARRGKALPPLRTAGVVLEHKNGREHQRLASEDAARLIRLIREVEDMAARRNRV